MVVGALTVFVAVSSVRTYPYHLPYCNEAFGGPARTPLRLHDSDVDRGHDLGRPADRLHGRYRGKRVWLVYEGSGVPACLLRHRGPSDPRRVAPGQAHGLLVVSDSVAEARDGPAVLLRSSRPVDEVGDSITLYRR
ncbi:hypothetical protein FBY34_5315 [Streptomyces sp. SLBN-115]|nr:hypothetical protein FBY34_5315 [Streptomyces sp. SLBN-115]